MARKALNIKRNQLQLRDRHEARKRAREHQRMLADFKRKKRHLTIAGVCGAVLLIGSAIVSNPKLSHATMAVFDSAAVAKITEQLNEAKKHLAELLEIKTAAQDQLDAIGKLGQIPLPSLNTDRLRRELASNLQCLALDFESLMPGVDFEDIRIGNLCDAKAQYRKTLFVNQENLVNLDWDERSREIHAARDRRENMMVEALVAGLATSHQGDEMVEHINSTASTLQSNADGAQTQNERLQVIAQAQVGQLRAQASQLQILTQMLRMQSAFFTHMGADATSQITGEEQ